jgi:hypothetical protein
MYVPRALAFLFLTQAALGRIEAYQEYVSKNPSTLVARETNRAPANPAADEVWVNTRSSKYWRPASRFYEKTRQGEYMPELDALDRGYSPPEANRRFKPLRK